MNRWFFLILFIYKASVVNSHALKPFQTTPPIAKHRYSSKFLEQRDTAKRIAAWSPSDNTNVWELSGLTEGDIMVYDSSRLNKNGLVDESLRWPEATLPYFIEDAFSNEEVAIILGAMQEYHDKTCIRFRPFTGSDQNWIEIKLDRSGCWSTVGMKQQGQVINLQSPKCVRHGVVVHELMHAIGFFHQHSAADRDDFIKIYWENIRKGREHNFKKYSEQKVTDFNVTYDYDSIMHYSAKAFSRDGNITIEPLHDNLTTLGQRVGLSERDIIKVNLMYSDQCNTDVVNILDQHMLQPEQVDHYSFFNIFQWWKTHLV